MNSNFRGSLYLLGAEICTVFLESTKNGIWENAFRLFDMEIKGRTVLRHA